MVRVSGENKTFTKCRGFRLLTDHGYDFSCEYNPEITCEECMYGAGMKNPEQK